MTAFNHLVLRYQDAVYTLCFRLTGNPDDAADAAQDAFLAAFTHIGDFRGARAEHRAGASARAPHGEGAGEGEQGDEAADDRTLGASFRNWLLRTAANACYDLHRRRRRRPAESLDHPLGATGAGEHEPGDTGALAGILADTYPGPEERTLQHELGVVVQQALLALPMDQRVAVVLCDVYGLDYQSIAAATDVELGTVKSRLHRARRQLRDLLLEHRELLPDRYRHR